MQMQGPSFCHHRYPLALASGSAPRFLASPLSPESFNVWPVRRRAAGCELGNFGNSELKLGLFLPRCAASPDGIRPPHISDHLVNTTHRSISSVQKPIPIISSITIISVWHHLHGSDGRVNMSREVTTRVGPLTPRKLAGTAPSVFCVPSGCAVL